jgi:uncharacterized protein (DUF1697 family)
MLRGINVSGQKLIKMTELQALYEALKFENVKTYIQSGNVIFRCKKTEAAVLENLIAKNILKKFGFDVSVMIKNREELSTVLQGNPFLNGRSEDISRLYVTFLSAEPGATGIEKLKSSNYGTGEFFIAGNTVYLFCPEGYGNTKLSNNFLENKLKVTATTRNWKTVNELYRLSELE